MRKSRFTEEQIIKVLKEHAAGLSAGDVCRKYGISDATFYKWRSRYGGMEISDARKLKALEDENRRLKKLLAETLLGSPMTVNTSGLRRATSSMHWTPRAGRKSARLMSPRMQERLSTVITCSSFRAIASRRLIRIPAACLTRFLRPGAPDRGLRGPKEHSGWGNIETGRSIKSIPTPGLFFAQSNPTALLQGLPGSMVNSGTRRWRTKKAICVVSILKRERSCRGSKCHRE